MLADSVTWHLGGLAVPWVQTQRGGGFSHFTLVQSQPLVLCAVLSGPVKDANQIIRVRPEKGDQDDERFQGQDL